MDITNKSDVIRVYLYLNLYFPSVWFCLFQKVISYPEAIFLPLNLKPHRKQIHTPYLISDGSLITIYDSCFFFISKFWNFTFESKNFKFYTNFIYLFYDKLTKVINQHLKALHDCYTGHTYTSKLRLVSEFNVPHCLTF